MTDLNYKAADFFGKPRNEIINLSEKPYETLMSSENTEVDEFWLQIRLGRSKSVNKTVKINESTFTITETYAPVQNYYGKIYKVICIINILSGESVISGKTSDSGGGGEFF